MSAVFTDARLAPRALYEEVAELLRQRIFQRELEPGSWIDELKIAEEYGISRTPLREALKVLAAEGLVTMKVRRGAYVTEVNEKDLRDVYHLLSLLESDAAGVVAERATTASGLTSLRGSLPKNSLTLSCTLGMRVMPPTRITSLMSETLMPASLMAVRQGAIVRSIRSSTRLSSLARVSLMFRCLGPVASAVM